MPLGGGYTAEEQLTGTAEYGGLQILVHPMKREAFERRFPERPDAIESKRHAVYGFQFEAMGAEMGLAPGGRMRQEIYEDPFDVSDWDRRAGSRCFVHLSNSLVWEAITGAKPPSPPPTAKTYTEQGLPWFDYYAEGASALDGAEALRRLTSVFEMGRQKGEVPLPENESVSPDRIIQLHRSSTDHVREGAF